jgi:predicted SnoaL-like aldol condensation-catalyzing enzyme
MFYKIMADGDMVTVIHQRYAPDPQHAGKFYEVFAFDTFRMQDGKMAEHWDDATIPNPLPPFLRAPMDKLHYPKQTQPLY